jgi:hypothetical protein
MAAIEHARSAAPNIGILRRFHRWLAKQTRWPNRKKQSVEGKNV